MVVVDPVEPEVESPDEVVVAAFGSWVVVVAAADPLGSFELESAVVLDALPSVDVEVVVVFVVVDELDPSDDEVVDESVVVVIGVDVLEAGAEYAGVTGDVCAAVFAVAAGGALASAGGAGGVVVAGSATGYPIESETVATFAYGSVAVFDVEDDVAT